MEKSDNNGNNNENGEDDYVFSPNAVGPWADSAPGASPAAEGGSEMPALEPIAMDVVEQELERAERGEEVRGGLELMAIPAQRGQHIHAC